ncbi:MAG: cupin, partial [Actinobacteria bacterium]|nr:cupin [Actinomycetota bacterium]NIU70503.1 cupin [Actinomycetota bacterium]NIW32399.1 cupin [Actinomycetota bacterium]
MGAKTGQATCQVEHVVLVVSGRAMIAMEDGREVEITAGDLCAI